MNFIFKNIIRDFDAVDKTNSFFRLLSIWRHNGMEPLCKKSQIFSGKKTTRHLTKCLFDLEDFIRNRFSQKKIWILDLLLFIFFV